MRQRLREPVRANWIGPGAQVITYPVRRGELLNFVGIVEGAEWVRESWTERGSREACAADFRGWHEDVQLLIGLLDAPLKWALMGREPLARWDAGNRHVGNGAPAGRPGDRRPPVGHASAEKVTAPGEAGTLAGPVVPPATKR